MAALGLATYRGLLAGAAPVLKHLLNKRVRTGKEDPDRVDERFGIASAPRPDGELVWLHAVSVGESLIALALAKALVNERDTLSVLITTNTRTSAELVAAQSSERLIHQFIVLDHARWVERFLAHWQPDLAVFTESELWPNLIVQTQANGVPMALVNARMNDRSIKGWTRFKTTAARLLNGFDWIGAADQRTAEGLQTLTGCSPALIGNLKLDLAPAPVDADALNALRAAISERPVVTMASTHAGEEALICEAFNQVLQSNPDALMILAPRHPERANDVIATLTAHHLAFSQRSVDRLPDIEKPVFLADTLGEMALWHSVSPVSVICGSFIDGIGGHNPIEASQLGSQIITGPYTASFDDVYAAYDAYDARQIADYAQSLSLAISALFNQQARTADAAQQAIASLSGGAFDQTLRALIALLDRKDV